MPPKGQKELVPLFRAPLQGQLGVDQLAQKVNGGYKRACWVALAHSTFPRRSFLPIFSFLLNFTLSTFSQTLFKLFTFTTTTTQ